MLIHRIGRSLADLGRKVWPYFLIWIAVSGTWTAFYYAGLAWLPQEDWTDRHLVAFPLAIILSLATCYTCYYVWSDLTGRRRG